MRRSGILLVLVTSVALAGCGSDQTAAKKPAAKVTTEAPRAVKTYVPAPGDPTKHVFHVTIRDEPPLDAYKAAADGKCSRIGVPEFPPQLVASGPDKDSDNASLGDFDIPKTARSVPDGTCQSNITVTVPFAPNYSLGIAIEGDGIAEPTEPADTNVVTKGTEQDITVRR